MNRIGQLRDALRAANMDGEVLAAQLLKLELLYEIDRVAEMIAVCR